ncbi:MAG: nucleotidyltransferase family protein [Mangrovibacterium sp.]
MQKILRNKIEQLQKLCVSLRVKRMHVFGSITSSRFTPESDVDFLISFSDQLNVEQYTDNYFELHERLRKIFNRRIDLVMEKTLSNPYFIESIEKTKQLIYEE